MPKMGTFQSDKTFLQKNCWQFLETNRGEASPCYRSCWVGSSHSKPPVFGWIVSNSPLKGHPPQTQPTGPWGCFPCTYLTGGGPASLERVTISLRQTSRTGSHHFISNYKEGTNPLESTFGGEMPPHSKEGRIPHQAQTRGSAGETNNVPGKERFYGAPAKCPDDVFGLQLTAPSSSISRDFRKQKTDPVGS